MTASKKFDVRYQPAGVLVDGYHRRLTTATWAHNELCRVRDCLRRVGCKDAADAVARALKSVDGAARHASGRHAFYQLKADAERRAQS